MTAPRGQAGSRANFSTLATRAKQQWLFVEPCVREPLMVTPLGSSSHPHFKPPPAQGWALQCYDREVAALRHAEARRAAIRRRRGGLDSVRTKDVTASLDVLFDGVTKGSEELYDGLPALSLDGQALATAITTHLARPTLPPPRALLRGLCTAAGLCMERATNALSAVFDKLLPRAEAIGTAMERSQSYWRTKLDELPEGCHAPLSSTRRWRRRAHCRHQSGRRCLGEPPWQPKSANAAVAAPRRTQGSRCAPRYTVSSCDTRHHQRDTRTARCCATRRRTAPHYLTRHRTTRHRAARHLTARNRGARHSTAQRRTERRCTARYRSTTLRTAWHRAARRRMAGHRTARHCTARHCKAQRLAARHRMARHSTRVHRVHASGPLWRLRGEMFQLCVSARAAFQTRTPAGGRGPRRRCPARTSTTVPARL